MLNYFISATFAIIRLRVEKEIFADLSLRGHKPEAILGGMGVSRWGWASCPSSIDRQDACPTGNADWTPDRSTGVTNDRQDEIVSKLVE